MPAELNDAFAMIAFRHSLPVLDVAPAVQLDRQVILRAAASSVEVAGPWVSALGLAASDDPPAGRAEWSATHPHESGHVITWVVDAPAA